MSTQTHPVQLTENSALPFSTAYRIGDIVFTSGQVGINPETGIVAEDFETEVRQTLDNLKQALEAAGSNLSAVVKTTCLITDMANMPEFNRIYTEVFQAPRPARSAFEVKLAQNFRIEVEAVAVVA